VVLEGSQEFLFFFAFTRFFVEIPAGQEFLNLLWIPPDSRGFLQIPVPANCCLARPATKEGSLLSKIWTKIDLFQPLLAEEAALEALVDVELETTIATADADNIRQQTTINNRLGAQLCLVVATTEVSSWR